MNPPKFAIGDLVRSRVNRSEGWIVVAFINRETSRQYLCADANGVETMRHGIELELGEREKDPCAVE